MNAELAAHFTQVTRNEQVAAYAVFVWDWLLCLEQEVDLISTRGFAPAKLAYLWCRYWPLVTYPVTIWVQVQVTDPARCRNIFQIPLILAAFNFSGAAAVLTVRVYAFSGQRLFVGAALACCFVVVAIYQLWISTSQIMLAPGAPACFPTGKPGTSNVLSGYFVAPFLFDLVATTAFLLHSARMKLQFTSVSRAVRVFLRDGIAYFAAISAINLANAAVNFQKNIVFSGVLAAMSMLLPSVLACRLIINLRSVSGEGAEYGTSRVSDNRRSMTLDVEGMWSTTVRDDGGHTTTQSPVALAPRYDTETRMGDER